MFTTTTKYSNHADVKSIYFNNSDDKGTQLKLSEQPDFEQKSEFLTKKRTTRTKVFGLLSLGGVCASLIELLIEF